MSSAAYWNLNNNNDHKLPSFSPFHAIEIVVFLLYSAQHPAENTLNESEHIHTQVQWFICISVYMLVPELEHHSIEQCKQIIFHRVWMFMILRRFLLIYLSHIYTCIRVVCVYVSDASFRMISFVPTKPFAIVANIYRVCWRWVTMIVFLVIECSTHTKKLRTTI